MRAIEFFAGVGLVHLTLERLGWEVVLANDIDERKAKTYRRNFPDTKLVVGDVHELDVSNLPKVELATASFPCIDLSQAGGRSGIDGKHSSAVWGFLDRIVDLHRTGNAPNWLLIENVPGLLWLHGGASIDALLRRLADLDYSFDVVQVDAKHFLPQSRNRVFVIAVKNGVEPGPTSHDPFGTSIRRYRVRDVTERNPNFPWHFFDFPRPPVCSVRLEDLLEELPPDDERWWSTERLNYFWRHLEHDHRTRMQVLVEAGATSSLTAVRRGRRRRLREQIFNIRWEGIASCIRTPKGGSSTQFVVRIVNGDVRVRRLLGLEAARLQGVGLLGEREYALPETDTAALMAFGDAVCVPALRWVVTHSIQRAVAGPVVVESAEQQDLALA